MIYFTTGLFQALAAVFVANHVRVLLHDRDVKGVSVFSQLFFTAIGLWNLVFYSSLRQWWSFAGGVLILSANTSYVILMLYYKRKNKTCSD